MTETVLILGGTAEAAELAARLVAEHPGWRVVTSFAGRTTAPAIPPGEVRTGGFGGVDGLCAWLGAERVTRMIDATHPFARRISAHAREASVRTGIPLEVLSRPEWKRRHDDDWVEVRDLVQARDALPSGARVLLAIGSTHVGVFAGRSDVFFLVRMVDAPEAPLPLARHEVVAGKPGGVEAEKALLARHGITHIVCRNSGGAGAYAKIEAARQMGITVLMVRRQT